MQNLVICATCNCMYIVETKALINQSKFCDDRLSEC